MAKLPLYGEDKDAKKMTRSVLAYVLDNTMRLMHPFMPFITEEIWQSLPHEGESITIAAWPTVNESLTDSKKASSMKLLSDIIRSVRTIRAEVQTPMSKKVPLYISAKDADTLAILQENVMYLEKFCNPEALVLGQDIQAPGQSMTSVVSGAELFLPLEGLIDIVAETARLEKELEKWAKEVKLVQGKLSNERFVSKAPDAVVAEERAKEQDYLDKYATVEKRLAELKNL
jgi:valyl-tRNA synthetase